MSIEGFPQDPPPEVPLVPENQEVVLPAQDNKQEITGKIKKEDVEAALKANGFGHPETMELVIKWTEQREEEVKNENTLAATMRLNVERADLLLAAEQKEDALREYEDLLEEADRRGEVEIQDLIVGKLRVLRVKEPDLFKKSATFKLLPENEMARPIESSDILTKEQIEKSSLYNNKAESLGKNLDIKI